MQQRLGIGVCFKRYFTLNSMCYLTVLLWNFLAISERKLLHQFVFQCTLQLSSGQQNWSYINATEVLSVAGGHFLRRDNGFLSVPIHSLLIRCSAPWRSVQCDRNNLNAPLHLPQTGTAQRTGKMTLHPPPSQEEPRWCFTTHTTHHSCKTSCVPLPATHLEGSNDYSSYPITK